MDERDFNAELLLQNERLRHEVEDLKTLQSVVKENLELRSILDSFHSTNHTVMEKSQISAGNPHQQLRRNHNAALGIYVYIDRLGMVA